MNVLKKIIDMLGICVSFHYTKAVYSLLTGFF